MAAPRPATLIILAWNRWQLTERCLRTLLATELDNCRIVVVDNGSTDETPERLKEFDGIDVMTNSENLGFVRGNNIAIEAADPSSDIVLLNNDLEFTQKDWLVRLRECAALNEQTGIVGCRLRQSSGRLQHAGTYIMPDTMWGQQIGSNEEDINQFVSDRRVQGIVFACALIKFEVIRAVGTLSLDFQSYFEDTDYCLRAQKAGYHTVVCGAVTLAHHEHGSTRGNSAGMMRIFQESRSVFRTKWSEDLEGRYTRNVHFQSIMNFPTGYAMSCAEILRALDLKGVRTSYSYVYGPQTIFPREEPEGFDDYRLNVFASRSRPRRPPISIVYGQGDVFASNIGRAKIGFTMLEVDGFPKEWVRQANKMAEVWVPSRFAKEAFLNCGLKRKIHIIPLGVNIDYFNPKITGHPNPMGEFTFLSLFEWGERKSPWLLLKAFNDTFSADEPVRLICKINNKDRAIRLKQEVASLGLRPDGGKISYILNQEFPRYQLGSLYRSADCFVSPSRGEGWNMPLMEAMACGLPSIGTDWGPHQEFLNETNGYPLRLRGLVPAIAKCPYYSGFSWADPDPEHLRHLLRHIFENTGEARLKGIEAARDMRKNWSWAATADKIIRRLREIEH